MASRYLRIGWVSVHCTRLRSAHQPMWIKACRTQARAYGMVQLCESKLRPATELCASMLIAYRCFQPGPVLDGAALALAWQFLPCPCATKPSTSMHTARDRTLVVHPHTLPWPANGRRPCPTICLHRACAHWYTGEIWHARRQLMLIGTQDIMVRKAPTDAQLMLIGTQDVMVHSRGQLMLN